MDNIILKLVTELPTAGAVIVTVVLFIRFIKQDRDDQHQERLATQSFFREIHAEHLDARRLTRDALERHSAITRDNIVATQKNTDTLERLSHSVEMCGVRIDLKHS